MEKSVLLNWLPFENTATGAAKRALELHSRLVESFDLRAVVTPGFPAGAAPGVPRVVISSARTPLVRLSERSPGFWLGHGPFGIWVTDTLPVPAFPPDIRVVLTVHDLRFLESRSYLSLQRYLLLRLTMAGALKRADAIVTVSRYTAKGITGHYGVPGERVHVIPNAAATLPEPCSTGGIQGKFLLSVGHLEPRKNHKTLLRAFARLAGDWDGNLVIAGTGPLEGRLRSMADDLGIASRVVFKGRISDCELAGLYASCACLVCPSVYEGFGMTILEGLEAGVPVIASRIPPHEEVAGDRVLWFSPEDHEDLAGKLAAFLESGALNHREKGRRHASGFSWDSSAGQLAEVYRGLLG